MKVANSIMQMKAVKIITSVVGCLAASYFFAVGATGSADPRQWPTSFVVTTLIIGAGISLLVIANIVELDRRRSNYFERKKP